MFADLADSDSEPESGTESEPSVAQDKNKKAQQVDETVVNEDEDEDEDGDGEIDIDGDDDDDDDDDKEDDDEEEDNSEDDLEDDAEQQERDEALSFRDLIGKTSRTGTVLTEGFVQAVCASFGAQNIDERSPTEVQRQSWQVLLESETWDRDVIAIAQTGSGKTLAFLVPLLAELASLSEGALQSATTSCIKPTAIVLAPTRELARQTEAAAEAVLAHPGVGIKLSVFLTIGGVSYEKSRQDLLDSNPHLIVATPGRFWSFTNPDAEDMCVSLDRIQSFVLDEADCMLDMGFLDDVTKIRSLMPAETRVILTSATWEQDSLVQVEAKKLCRTGQSPIYIGVDSQKGLTAARTVQQRVEVVKHKGAPRFRLLVETLAPLVKDNAETDALAIVFVMFKQESKKVAQDLREEGIPAVALNGDMSQTARHEALETFKRGEALVLVATDVAARGLDVPSVELVVNYSLGMTIEEYVHRIGRCGRAGRAGRSVTFFLRPDDCKLGPELVKVLEDSHQQVPVDLRILAEKEVKARARKTASASSSTSSTNSRARGGGGASGAVVLDQDEADRLEQQRANREKQLRLQRQRDAKSGKKGGGKSRRGRR
ncbi:ATP-dependent RNA helicase dbp3 [Hondaea fermentalgiana]|uniref:RNA helicase n=1 Tax=Hondaea fermentalgiana TaxID=2315210 RepID=A0A2R5GGW1_9STRA|nr:ATP-dependent RNA helicase dbp3 [Hondaea fermentalgiana]|eukprot:GBG30146.1 ATP-dependent RNA helicase dbp3 [Hondaea fermentalgiana]